MKKTSWLKLYYLGAIAVDLSILYVYYKGLAMLAVCLAIPALVVMFIGARLERKWVRENPEIKGDKSYRITRIVGNICGLLLAVGVWFQILLRH